MAVQDTGIRAGLVRAPPAPDARPLRSVRRLPTQKDWPFVGSVIVAPRVGGGDGIGPCIPTEPDCGF